MGFFNNIGVTPPTKDNIYSLFCIPEIYYRYYGKVLITKTSAGIRISIENEIDSNERGKTHVTESRDYDTEEIVKRLVEKQVCVEEIREIRLNFTTKSRMYKPDAESALTLICQPDAVLAEIFLKTESASRRDFMVDIDPIEM